jgi:hypothetical protein
MTAAGHQRDSRRWDRDGDGLLDDHLAEVHETRHRVFRAQQNRLSNPAEQDCRLAVAQDEVVGRGKDRGNESVQDDDVVVFP